MKKFAISLTLSFALAFSALGVACSNQQQGGDSNSRSIPAEFTTEITGIDNYSDYYLAESFDDFYAKGYEMTDYVDVNLPNMELKAVKIVGAFQEAGIYSFCISNNSGSYSNLALAIVGMNLSDYYPYENGTKVTIKFNNMSLSKAEGIDTTLRYSKNRDDFSSDEVFANFRSVDTTNIKKNTIYRGTNIFENKETSSRVPYADKLCEQAGIKTDIDLSQSKSDIEKALQDNPDVSKYGKKLFDEGKVYADKINNNYYYDKTVATIRDTMLQVANSEAPFYIHCNEGKDRTGFICLVLEALCAGNQEEIASDYMESYTNFYNVQPGTEKYELVKKLTFDRIVYVLDDPERVKSIDKIDWENINVANVDLNQAAYNYCKNVLKLSDAEIQQIVLKLTR